MKFTAEQIWQETSRLHEHLRTFEYSWEDCEAIAPITLEINALKEQKNALILAHSYQSPEIKFGVADKLGDSYGLALDAKNTAADIIIFSSVLFMGETAKILNPSKTVLVPTRAGCSLADSITAADVKNLRKQNPDAGFVAYVNTSAEVKAEVDACCTSSNALKVVEAMSQNDIVFLPDRLMGKNLQKMTRKNLILWDGVCVVHEEFTEAEVKQVRQEFPHAEILAHPECDPKVIKMSDFVGSTEQMLNRLDSSAAHEFMMITECGLAERARKEKREKTIVGTCHLCPYMKQLKLKDILQALKEPRPGQRVEIPEHIRSRAEQSLNSMFQLEERYNNKFGKAVPGWKL